MVITQNLWSQFINDPKNLFKVYSPSPTAATLGIYGQIPVNLFNGVPNINIDLYKLKVDEFELPISLSYHIGSVKPDEKPGVVGLGWNLNTGGAITRIVNDKQDEYVILGQYDPTLYAYYYHYGLLDRNDWYSTNNLIAYNECFHQHGNLGCLIPSPDEFAFNFNGISGSFMKNHKGVWVVKANKNIDIKVEEELTNSFDLLNSEVDANNKDFIILKTITAFTLTTDDGIKYVFGKNPDAIEFGAVGDKNEHDNVNNHFISKTWFLTKIILNNNKEITFNYTSSANIPSTTSGYTNNPAVYKRHVTSYFNDYDSQNVTGSNGSGKIEGLERQFVVYLRSINTPDAQISFDYSLTNDLDYDFSHSPWQQYQADITSQPGFYYVNSKHWYKLNNMVVKSKMDNNQIYKVNFSYKDIPTSRLFLTKIEESGTINTPTVRKHSFEYDPMELPPYNSQKIDHWGFYNGTNFFANNPPNNGFFYTKQLLRNYPSSRNSNPAFLQAGILKKINFPTGGFTNFFYEPHDFSKVVNKTLSAINLINANSSNEITGGLRIKKIVSDPLNSGNPITKEYFYVKDYKNNDFSSSGILAGRPEYIDEGGIGIDYYFFLNSSNFCPLSDTNGNHITYTTVVEKNQNEGFTEFKYSNHDNGFIDKRADNAYYIYSGSSPLSTIKKFLSNSMASERGNLLEQNVYNYQKKLVEKTIYNYDDDPNRLNDNIRVINYFETSLTYAYENNTPLPTVVANTVYSNHVHLKSKENTIYDITNNLSTTNLTTYNYSNASNFHQLKSQTSTNSLGETIQVKNYYAPDIEMASQPLASEMVNRNMISNPLNTMTFNNSVKLSESITQFGSFASSLNVARPIILPKSSYAGKFPNNLPLIPNIGNIEKKISYDKYDDRGNLLQYTTESGIPVSIIWGYNKTLPIAKLENVIYNNIPSSIINSLEIKSANDIDDNSENLLRIDLDGLRISFPNAMIDTYTYNPLIGVTTMTDSKGNKSLYNYDTFGRLKLIKDNTDKILEEYQYHYKN
jgi:hypothetical protein